MNDNDPTAIIETAMPDDPPPARFDLDRIVSDGYRSRRRHRAALGGATAAGVAVLAAATVLAVTVNAPGQGQQAAEQDGSDAFGFDTAMAGYPVDDWSSRPDSHLQAQELTQEAKEAFGDLAVEAGYVEPGGLDYGAPDELETQALVDEGMSYGEALAELGYEHLPLQFTPTTVPGNGGEVDLRGYTAGDGDAEAETPAFTIEAMLPGGWTAEPGPGGEMVFPQPLISDDADEFTSEELDDGRLLMVAEDGCSYDLAVVYPNESALRSSWDLGCSGEEHDVSLEELTEAMLAMPETDYDTGELVPVEELIVSRYGGPSDDDWPEGAAVDAATTAEAVDATITGLYPEARVETADALAPAWKGTTILHQYVMTVTLPFEAFEGEDEARVDVAYTLPGDWTPWSPDADEEDVQLPDCEGNQSVECEQVEIDGRTAVLESDAENGVYEVTVLDEDGWAVNLFMTFEGEFELTPEEFAELAAALPAPVYDEEAVSGD